MPGGVIMGETELTAVDDGAGDGVGGVLAAVAVVVNVGDGLAVGELLLLW